MILIIDNYDSFTYNLYQLFRLVTDSVRVLRNDAMDLASLADMDISGVCLSPGPGRPEQAGICVPLIQAMITGRLKVKPLLGVCLGHQALVVAMGGQVIAASEIRHGKQSLIFHQQQGLYQDLPHPFTAGRYHSLIADEISLPDDLEIEARTESGEIMGIRHRRLPFFGVQFHPESILTPQGKEMIDAFYAQCEVRVGANKELS